MGLSLRVSPGDWGGVAPEFIEAVAVSAADSFAACDEDEPVAIELRATASDQDPPKAHSALSPDGAFVIEANVRGAFWAQLAYQFAHEFCHVLADPRTIVWDRFTWIEEVLCETASLFAIRRMAESWRSAPPYPFWRDYSTRLWEYEGAHIAEPSRCVPSGESFESWLVRMVPLLEADSGRREDNTVIAKELFPIFESTPGAWRAVRSLHVAPRSALSSAEYLSGWVELAPEGHRAVIREIQRTLT